MNIIEYIGKEGIKTTSNKYAVEARMKTPKPGDVVIWEVGEYPFHKENYGRIDGFGKYSEDKYLIICEPGSVFLYPEGDVSISGGPFSSVYPEELIPTYQTKLVRFWNWGDNLPGGGKGVDFYIERPVFKYIPKTINQ